MYLTEKNSSAIDSARPGVNGAVRSTDKTEPSALRFRSQQDALDYAAHVLEDNRRQLAAQRLNAFDRYAKGEVTAYIGLRSRRTNHQCHLAFSSVPTERSVAAGKEIGYVSSPFFVGHLGVECDPKVIDYDGDESAVFLGVTELVHGPEDFVLPSFVWLEAAKQRHDFRRDILATLPAFNIVVEIGEVVSERKVSCFGGALSGGDSAGVSGLIKNGTEVVDGIEEDARQHIRQVLREPDFMNALSRLRLFINEVGTWLAIDKIANDCIEVTDVMLCSAERQPMAIEDTGHGKQT